MSGENENVLDPYAAPASRGFISASDSMRIDRFLSRIVRLGYLPEDCSTFHELVNVAEDRLLSAVIDNPDHVLLPLFPLSRIPPLWSSNASSSVFPSEMFDVLLEGVPGCVTKC